MDIIRGMHASLRKSGLRPALKIRALIALGEAEFRLVEGASDKIQVDALIAKLVDIQAREDI